MDRRPAVVRILPPRPTGLENWRNCKDPSQVFRAIHSEDTKDYDFEFLDHDSGGPSQQDGCQIEVLNARDDRHGNILDNNG
jgi:hypothetical protein